MIKQLSITVFFRVTDFRVTEKQKWELDTVLRTLHGKLYFGSKYAVPIFLCFLNFHVWWFFCLLQFDYCLQKFLNEASIKCPRPENVGRQQGKAFVSFIFFFLLKCIEPQRIRIGNKVKIGELRGMSFLGTTITTNTK